MKINKIDKRVGLVAFGLALISITTVYVMEVVKELTEKEND